MNNQEIINQTIEFVKEKLKNAEWWHDWRHIYRVWKLANKLLETEKWDYLTVQLSVLLHDIADWKFHDWNEKIWPNIAWEFLKSIWIDNQIIENVKNIILNIWFKWWNHEQKFKSPELDIVQDADRLDAIWAIWVARTFSYGWFKWREIYNPETKPNLNMTKEEYVKSNSPTINHFYEKLLLLKDKMNTATWKKIAEHRHKILENYLEEFYNEWEGKL